MKPLKTYRCVGTVVGGKYLGEVEARSKAKAVQLAWELEQASVSLCHQCSSQVEDAEITKISVEVDEDAGDGGEG